MIVCVDPDDDARTATAARLADAGFDTAGCGSAAEAREVLRGDDAVECLVTETRLPDGSGLDLVAAARERAPDAACVLFTGDAVEDVDTETAGDLVVEYLSKSAPDARDELVDLVGHALSFRSQTAYPLPEDEDARLAALDRYAADPAELGASLDRLTELATAQFDLNSAAVGLVTAHEERFLACHGADFGALDREETICTYAILDDGVTVVESVPDDPRFADSDVLESGGVRFYAGAPLVTPGGRRIGTFCLHDDEPREFGERDRTLLSLYADEAVDQLELRRRLREAEEDRDD